MADKQQPIRPEDLVRPAPPVPPPVIDKRPVKAQADALANRVNTAPKPTRP